MIKRSISNEVEKLSAILDSHVNKKATVALAVTHTETEPLDSAQRQECQEGAPQPSTRLTGEQAPPGGSFLTKQSHLASPHHREMSEEGTRALEKQEAYFPERHGGARTPLSPPAACCIQTVL